MSGGDKGISRVDGVLDILGILWNPGVEAMRVQKEVKARSLEETIAVTERAGYEVCLVDLPEKISGFATMIAGKPHIVLNRAKSRHHMHYTVSHELGHHVLQHLNPSQYSNSSAFLPTEALQEYQAHMFASTWVWFTPDRNTDMEVMLRQNPESIVVYLAIFGSLAVILFTALAHVASLLFSKPPANAETNR
jgi:Zn-dependent peptidase ImmA (M78 family)